MKNYLRFFSLIFILSLGWTGLHAGNLTACVNTPSARGVQPETIAFIPGNAEVNCLGVGAYRFDNPSGVQTFNDGYGNTIKIKVTMGGQKVEWWSTGGIVVDRVLVKGGPEQNEYLYTTTYFDDQNLHAPCNEESGSFYGISHVDFCYSYKLTIQKTAFAAFDRDYDWNLDKYCLGPNPLTLAVGEQFDYLFKWVLTGTYTDENFRATGTITITNNTPFTANILNITDVITAMGQPDISVYLPYTFPLTLAKNASLTYNYSVSLPNNMPRTNRVAVVTDMYYSPVKGGSATAEITFGPTPSIEYDKCVTVYDNCPSTSPMEVCYAGTTQPYVYQYQYYCLIGPYTVCGSYQYINSAYIDPLYPESCTVNINVPCNEGCTLTQGYWKTHSEFGPAPYDNTWAQLPNGAYTPFYSSGKSYYQVLWTPPAGNAAYTLAHQYIAAQLNFLNGADPSAAQAAFDWATNYFTNTNPTLAKPNGAIKKDVTDYAKILDNYNNGLIGPGHCDEDHYTPPTSAGYSDMEEGQTETVMVKATPNPFTSEVQFELVAPYSGPFTLDLLNANGQKVASIFSGYMEAGQQSHIRFDAAGLPEGMYIYRLITGQEVKSGQLMSVK